MKSLIIKFIYKNLLYPPKVKFCSQTIYQSLLGCLHLWDFINKDIWHNRAKQLCDILIEIQQPDGGFDIGYDFNFGLFHRKGESTSPELVALWALVEYYKRFKYPPAEKAMHRAASWIKDNVIWSSDEKCYIPYAPYSTKEIIVYNGTSFAAGSLGIYLSFFPDNELEKIYHAMNSYLYSVMSETEDFPGSFWYYNDQDTEKIPDKNKTKIDYYHQMQQVEIHSAAYLALSDNSSIDLEQSPCLKIIKNATEHVLARQNKAGSIPYTNSSDPENPIVHTWGFCSCASGFLNAAKLIPKRKDIYINAAIKVYNWILNNSWNGNYFHPIISASGKGNDTNYYIRSDAWVFNSLAFAVKNNIDSDRYLEICEKTFTNMSKHNFSGIENHALCFRKKVVFNLLSRLSKIKY